MSGVFVCDSRRFRKRGKSIVQAAFAFDSGLFHEIGVLRNLIIQRGVRRAHGGAKSLSH